MGCATGRYKLTIRAALDRERAKLELRAARLLTQIDDDLGAPDRQAEGIPVPLDTTVWDDALQAASSQRFC